MALLREAVNEMAYAKIGILGFAGSGKTYTATEIAIGLHKHIGSKKPIAFLDTETGSDFMVGKLKSAGIKMLVAKTKTFPDLLEFMNEAVTVADIAIIDSISHIWNEIQRAFLDKINKDRSSRNIKKLYRLEFQHWNQIKPEWARFTSLFLECPMHVILCGRAGYEYDYEQQDPDSKKELIKTGVKMKAEGEMAYEPSLLIEMERVQENPTYQRAAKERMVTNRAFVIKDRADLLDGRYFDNPSFATFLPHFQYLNIGGKHHATDAGTSSETLFDDHGKSDFDREKHNRTKYLEEIQGLMTSKWPGQTAAEKKAKSDILDQVFATRSWTALEDMPSFKLAEGLEKMNKVIKGNEDETPPANDSPSLAEDYNQKYIDRIKAALNRVYGNDTKAGLDKVEELSEWKDSATGEIKAKGTRDFRTLKGKRLEILCHNLEKLVPKDEIPE